MLEKPDDHSLEVKLLLEAIYEKYNYDFREYAMTSVKRRLTSALSRFSLPSISAIQEKILHDQTFFLQVLQYLTVPTSEMFRDPNFYLAFREKVVPQLATYPSLKLWIAGCSTGEEVYSYAILLKEEGLFERTMIYATDINPVSLQKAEEGIFLGDKVREFTSNYQKSGGKSSFSDYFTASDRHLLFDKNLRKNVVFADHSLATDSVFSEVQVVSCRNVLIYFNRDLQNRALDLFRDSLTHKGFLCLGSKETLKFSRCEAGFDQFSGPEKIYRRN